MPEQAEKQAGKRYGTRGILHPKMREKMIKPGERRNPNGRPKGRSLVAWINAIGREALPADLAKQTGCSDWNELLARNATKKALKDHTFFKSILDLHRERAELLNQFLEIVNSANLTAEDIKSDPTFYEAAIRCGYFSDSEGESGEDSGAEGEQG